MKPSTKNIGLCLLLISRLSWPKGTCSLIPSSVLVKMQDFTKDGVYKWTELNQRIVTGKPSLRVGLIYTRLAIITLRDRENT